MLDIKQATSNICLEYYNLGVTLVWNVKHKGEVYTDHASQYNYETYVVHMQWLEPNTNWVGQCICSCQSLISCKWSQEQLKWL